MKTRERIACCAVAVLVRPGFTSYVTVKQDRLVMDIINSILKNHPDINIDRSVHFVTTHGRVLDAIAAFSVALEANQIIDDKAKPPLTQQHINRRN